MKGKRIRFILFYFIEGSLTGDLSCTWKWWFETDAPAVGSGSSVVGLRGAGTKALAPARG